VIGLQVLQKKQFAHIAQGGFQSSADSACFQVLTLQSVAAILLQRVEWFGTAMLSAATNLTTSEHDLASILWQTTQIRTVLQLKPLVPAIPEKSL
jgi:hypothetical protein